MSAESLKSFVEQHADSLAGAIDSDAQALRGLIAAEGTVFGDLGDAAHGPDANALRAGSGPLAAAALAAARGLVDVLHDDDADDMARQRALIAALSAEAVVSGD